MVNISKYIFGFQSFSSFNCGNITRWEGSKEFALCGEALFRKGGLSEHFDRLQ